MEIYPRFTITRAASGRRVGYRVSGDAARALIDSHVAAHIPYSVVEHTRPPRFRIKMATWPTRNPVVLFDASRPAFRGQYVSIEQACRAMDNTVRRERGMPERIDWANLRRVTPHVEPSELHVGQHLQGCRACYASNAAIGAES